MKGALTTFERFASEFEEEGLLSRLTEDQKRAAWVPTTNDANEGALGRYRLSVRAAPRVTNEYFNSLNKHYYNNTQDFMEGVLTSFESQSHLRRVARARDAATYGFPATVQREHARQVYVAALTTAGRRQMLGGCT